MPLVRRRRPLLRVVAIVSGAYAAGKRRRHASPAAPAGDVKADAPESPEQLKELFKRDALNGASNTERNRK